MCVARVTVLSVCVCVCIVSGGLRVCVFAGNGGCVSVSVRMRAVGRPRLCVGHVACSHLSVWPPADAVSACSQLRSCGHKAAPLTTEGPSLAAHLSRHTRRSTTRQKSCMRFCFPHAR